MHIIFRGFYECIPVVVVVGILVTHSGNKQRADDCWYDESQNLYSKIGKNKNQFWT